MDAGTTSLLCLPHLLTQYVHECRAPSHRADSGHISFGGIVQSPSVATVAANIEAVGAPLALKAPDLLPRVLPPAVTPPPASCRAWPCNPCEVHNVLLPMSCCSM